jgi:isoleucyl-tRNA synthetase
LNDLSRKYIQIIRDRLSSDDKEAQSVAKEVFLTITKLLAPINPFITEYIWQDFRKKKIVKEESVHLCSWPKYNEKKIDPELEENFKIIFDIIEKGLAERNKLQIGLKWPLAKATIHSSEKLNKDYEKIILNQLNVKKIGWKKGKELSITLDKKITPRLEAEGYAREISRLIQSFRKKLGLNKNDMVTTYIITDENFKKILISQRKMIKERTNSDELDIITSDKEKFKNKVGFEIKDKRGDIAIVQK